MKRVWRKDNKEGVSPVIATILMVAITVVLAAVLYAMIGGLIGPKNDPPFIGQLTYKADSSSPDTGKAVFTLTMSQPTSVDSSRVRVTALDSEGSPVVAEYEANWTTFSDNGYVESGDRMTIVAEGTDISDWEIIVKIDGYSNIAACTVP